MPRVEALQCDADCNVQVDVTTYTITDDTGTYELMLCRRHAAPIEQLLRGYGRQAKRNTARGPRKLTEEYLLSLHRPA